MTMPVVRRVAVALACVTAMLAAVVPAALAEPVLEQGTALPWRYETTLRYFQFAGVSQSYVMHSRADAGDPDYYSVVRAADGQVVAKFAPRGTTGNEVPQLVDHSYLELTPSNWSPGHLDIHDVETGQQSTIDLTSHDNYVHGDDQWALVTDYSTDPADTGHQMMSFVWPDKTVTVPSLNVDSNLTWVGGDSSAAFVTDNARSFQVDPATGAVTLLTLPDGSPLPLFAVTDKALITCSVNYPAGQTVAVDHFTVISRGTGQVTGQVDVPVDSNVRWFLPWNSGIAAVTFPVTGARTVDGNTIYRYDLQPVDMTSGVLQAPVATDIVDAQAMGNGSVAVAIGDVPTGRIAVASSGGAVTPVADLPQVGYASHEVGLSGGTAITSLEGPPGLWTTSDDGTGQWSQTYPDSSPAIDAQARFAVGGDVVLTRLPDTRGRADPEHYRVAWPGGFRDVDSVTEPQLGSDGHYLIRTPPGSTGAEVEDARTGDVDSSWTNSVPRHLDSSWLWTGPTADGTLTGVDLADPARHGTEKLPLDCKGSPSELMQVRGRWALTRCNGWTLVDLWGVVDPWTVTTSTSWPYAQLGDGFIAWVAWSNSYPQASLQVADLTAAHTSRSYGPLRNQSYPLSPAFAVDTADRPDLVYGDDANRVRHVHLDWLGKVPTTRGDQTAPELTGSPRLSSLVRSAQPVAVTPSWTYREPDLPHEPQSGLGTYDVRWQSYPDGGDTWVQPASWSGMPSATIGATLKPGTGRCFESRARDKDGNASAWSAPACSYVDGAAPVLAPATGSAQFFPKVMWPVTYRYAATDDDAVASYDVQVRKATRGRPLGTWHDLLPATQQTSVSMDTTPGIELCFRFRARDVAGNSSGWSPIRCNVLPIDDSEFDTQGPVTQGTNDSAIVGTYTELDKRGASATLRGQTGRTVGLWGITGPYEGPVDVYAGGHYLGRVGLKSAYQRRSLLLLHSRRTWSGAVRVVAASRRPSRLDAIGVLR